MNKSIIPLTAEALRSHLSYDPDTGIFTRKVSYGKWLSGSIAGSLDVMGYIKISVDHYVTRAHRLAWLYVYGVWPTFEIDHINGVRHDNRLANLRDVNRLTNSQNTRMSKGKSGYLGAHISRNGKFMARITKTVNGKVTQFHIGTFNTPEEAHQAYLVKKREIHEGCTI